MACKYAKSVKKMEGYKGEYTSALKEEENESKRIAQKFKKERTSTKSLYK